MLKLNYVFPDGPVVEAGVKVRDDEIYPIWLHKTVDLNPEVIFFYTVETTDVWDFEIDFNTVAYWSGDGLIKHTYEPMCPEGCHGQLKDCIYKNGVLSNAEEEPIAHSCSCHDRDAGPCEACEALGCEPWNFNCETVEEGP